MKYTLYYHDRAIDPISVLGQIYAPGTTGGVNIASVFFSDYNYSEAANSSTKTNVLSDHLIWEQPSIYDWDYDVVHERAGFSDTQSIDLLSGHRYKVEYVAKGGRADHHSHNGSTNTNSIAGGGGGGGFVFTVRVNSDKYKLYTYDGGVQLRNASGTNIITGSADNGRNASGKSPGTGGCASVTRNTTDSNIILESSSACRGGGGGATTIRHSKSKGSVSGGRPGISVSNCFKMPKGAFTAFIDKITKFWSTCLTVNNTKKPTSKSTVSAKNYNATLAAQAKIFESFKAFCHGFNKIKIPESSGTHKYLKWKYLSDADDTHIGSLDYLNIKSDSVTVIWKDASGSKQTQKVTIWLKDSTSKTFQSKLRSDIYSNTKYKKKVSWYLNEVMTAPSDILIKSTGRSGGYGKGSSFYSERWNDGNPGDSPGTNYIRVTILD